MHLLHLDEKLQGKPIQTWVQTPTPPHKVCSNLPPRPLKNRLVRPGLTFLGHHTLLIWQDQLNISSSSLLGNCNHHHKYYPTFGAFTPKCT